jgi:hypothetical protein
MPAGSEQISVRWVEGAVRECRACGVKITNLAKQVGEVRTLYGGKGHGERQLLCMSCHVARTEGLKERLYGR